MAACVHNFAGYQAGTYTTLQEPPILESIRYAVFSGTAQASSISLVVHNMRAFTDTYDCLQRNAEEVFTCSKPQR